MIESTLRQLTEGWATLPAYVNILIVGLGVVSLAWAVFRTSALTAWRAAAEGYKAQVEEMKPRLERAEKLAVSLQAQITELERRPDLGEVLSELQGLRHDLRAGPLRGASDGER